MIIVDVLWKDKTNQLSITVFLDLVYRLLLLTNYAILDIGCGSVLSSEKYRRTIFSWICDRKINHINEQIS